MKRPATDFSDGDDDDLDEPPTKRKVTKPVVVSNYHKLARILANVMIRVRSFDFNTVRQRLGRLADANHPMVASALARMNNIAFSFNKAKIVSAAQSEARFFMANNMVIDDVLLQFVTVDLRIYDKPFLTLEDSMVLLDNWFLHNGWDALEFITNLFRVLTKAAEKVNVFLVMGPSNSGKTMMLLQPLSVLVSNVGRIPSLNAASNNFVWQDCLNTNLICIDECVIQPGSFEEAKQIFAGEDTSVNIKHSPQAILKRTPIVACTNRQPWVFAPNEKDALS